MPKIFQGEQNQQEQSFEELVVNFWLLGNRSSVQLYAGNEDLIDGDNWNANHTSITNYKFTLLTRIAEPESMFADLENVFLDIPENDKINFGKLYCLHIQAEKATITAASEISKNFNEY